MKLLGFDLETTGTDPATCLVTEVGAVMLESLPLDACHCEPYFGYRETLCVEELCYDSATYPPIPQELVDLNGISTEMLKEKGRAPAQVLSELIALMEGADYIVAHNGRAFDQKVLEARAKIHGLTIPKKEWIDTLVDVPYPAKYKCRKLSHLALDHGLKMDHRHAHRAGDDIRMMLELVLGCYGLQKILDYRAIPWIVVRAIVSYDDRELAKAQRFSWEKLEEQVFPKFWVKRIKLNELEELQKACSFKVARIK